MLPSYVGIVPKKSALIDGFANYDGCKCVQLRAWDEHGRPSIAMNSTNTARHPSAMHAAKLGLSGLTIISWIAGVTYLRQLTGDASLPYSRPLVLFVVLTFIAGFYYGERRAPASFYYAGRRRGSAPAWQVWLAGLTIPVGLHWFVHQLFIDGSVDTAGIFSLSLLLNSILLITTWWWSVSTSTELRGLEVHPEELPDSRGFRYEHPAASSHRRTCFRRLHDRWIAGAALLAGVIAILGSSSRELHLPVPEVGLFLVAGFGLLALSHLVRSRAIWEIEPIGLPNALARRWMSSALTFVAVGAVVAMLLPTGYAGIIPGVFARLAGTLNSVSISLPSPPSEPNRDSGVVLPSPDMRLVNPMPPVRPQTPAQDPPPASSATSPPSELTLTEPILTIGLLIVTTILIYTLARFFWRRRATLSVLRVLDYLARLSWLVVLAVISVVRDLIYVGRQVAQSSVATASTRRSAFNVRMPAFRLRSLDERGWLEYMVLSLFRRAERLGRHRPPNMTAGEYASHLRSDLAIAEPELSLLIDRFHQTRYGEHSPSTDEVDEAKRWWIRLKAVFQRVRVPISRERARLQANRTVGTPNLARTESPLKPNSGEPPGWFRVVDMILGIARAVFFVALFLVGLVAIIAISAALAGVVDPGAFVR